MTGAKKEKRNGVIWLAVTLVVLLIGLVILEVKIGYDLSTPFTYHLKAVDPENGGKDEKAADGSISAKDAYSYSVDISKKWKNNPDTPLQTYGAQYDNSIINDSSYDLVKWSVVMEVPEKNITIDSSWNGDWQYDKSSSTITFHPDDRISTIVAGDYGTFGAVMISKELMDFTDITLTGCRHKAITQFPVFWVIMVLLVAWVTSAVYYVFYRIREDAHRRSEERLNNVISQTMSTFANFIDTKDKYTKGHSTRVSYYSMKIAEKLGMGKEQVRDIGYIGLMHDCGKLATPDNILNKPGRLSEEEFGVMKAHTSNGDSIVKDFTAIDGIRDGVLYHHERYDGKGYMSGLAGEDIPLVARIICVADALDAMNSDRCYRQHLSREVILAELENNKGTQFDPDIADLMIKMIENGEIYVGNDEDNGK